MTTAKRHSNPCVGDDAGHASPLQAAINYLLVCLLVIALFWVSLAMLGYTFDFSFVSQYRMRIAQGFLLTIEISAASLVAAEAALPRPTSPGVCIVCRCRVDSATVSSSTIVSVPTPAAARTGNRVLAKPPAPITSTCALARRS